MTQYKILCTFKSGKVARLGEAHDMAEAKKELERIKQIYAPYDSAQAPVRYEIIRREISPWEVVVG